jgi:hypothetical protein
MHPKDGNTRTELEPHEARNSGGSRKDGEGDGLRKSLGPDGFTTDFFQARWNIIGKDIWEVVEESVISQGRAPVVIMNCNMFCRLVSQVL